MTTREPEAVEFLTQALSPLVAPLYETLDSAAEIAAAHFADYDMDSSEYQPCEAHLARAHARRLLKAKQAHGEMTPWVITAPAPNVPICLARDLLRLRMLRPDRLQVPKPGTNAARRAYYSNHHAQLHGIASSLLLGLWAPDEDGHIRVQVVRTIGEARYGSHVRVDIKFWLPRDAEDISKLEFSPNDDEMDVTLPFEESETGEERETDNGSN